MSLVNVELKTCIPSQHRTHQHSSNDSPVEKKGKLPRGEKWKWGVKFRRDVGLLAGRRDSILLRE